MAKLNIWLVLVGVVFSKLYNSCSVIEEVMSAKFRDIDMVLAV